MNVQILNNLKMGINLEKIFFIFLGLVLGWVSNLRPKGQG
jgi:hypothetical protein